MSLREFFSDPSKWTRGSFARNAEGDQTYSASEDACSWCIVGGITKSGVGVSNVDTQLKELAIKHGLARNQLGDLTTNISQVSLTATNDAITFEELTKWLEAACV